MNNRKRFKTFAVDVSGEIAEVQREITPKQLEELHISPQGWDSKEDLMAAVMRWAETAKPGFTFLSRRVLIVCTK